MRKKIIALAIVTAIVPVGLFAFSDQTTTERILRENKHFVEFLNVCLSNFGDSRREDFLKAYQQHFNADVAYLQSDYKRAYHRVYASQGDMEKMYHAVLRDAYLEDSKAILDTLAPDIIRSKNARARLYLTLGYRDRTVSWTHFTIGENSNPKLYSYKIYQYIEGIKVVRRAKRYAFLALFECQTIETKRKIYNQLSKLERESGTPFMSRFVDLKDDEYIKEMNKTYEDFLKEEAARKPSGEGTAPRPAPAEKDVKGGGSEKKGGEVFEKTVEKRVRFRSEARASRYLLNGEFDKAEDIMREYIDDFNFKLINATFKVITEGQSDAAKGDQAKKINYEQYRTHLLDNYSRFARSSLMESYMDRIKVEDDVKRPEGERAPDESGKKDTDSTQPVKKDEPRRDAKPAEKDGRANGPAPR